MTVLEPYYTAGTLCAGRLITMFNTTNSLAFSETQLKCIGTRGLRTCYSVDDTSYSATGVYFNDDISDCTLCETRVQCQDLLRVVAENITADPGSCSLPSAEDSDLETIVFLRYQLDVFCSGVLDWDTNIEGKAANLQYLTQCRCGAVSCPPGVYCAENTLPELCPEGYYCPDYAGDKYECSEGNYCPKGATEEIKCSGGASCPAGSSRQYEYLPFLLLWLVLIIGGSIELFLLYCKPASCDENTGRWAQPAEGHYQAKDSKIKVKTVSKNTMAIEFDKIEVMIKQSAPCCGIGCCCRPEPLQLLESTTGTLVPGQLTGVMGPSGSGKSTFVKAVCGKIDRSNGVIRVNGEEHELGDYRELIGFVPQQDKLDMMLSVSEAILFSANTRLNGSSAEKRAKVARVMRSLDIFDQRDSIIETLSGGQKKRVNIALELVADPSAIFLDEPTTGLDATTAQSIMLKLQQVAHESKIIVCAVIHQPRPTILNMIDQLILLVKGGRCAWMGSVPGAIAYFESKGYKRPQNTDAADFISDIIAGVASSTGAKYEVDMKKRDENMAKLAQAPGKSEGKVAITGSTFGSTLADTDLRATLGASSTGDSKGVDDEGKPLLKSLTKRSVNCCAQMWYYLERAFRLRVIRTNRQLLDGFAHMAAGIIIGIIFHASPILVEKIDIQYGASCPYANQAPCTDPQVNDIGMWGFYNTMGLGLVAMVSAIQTFGGMRKIVFWREAAGGASTTAYFFGECIMDILAVMVNTIFYAAAVQLLVPLRTDIGNYWVLYLCVAFTVTGVGYILSIALTEISNAMIFATVLSIVMTLFEGFIDKIGDYAYWCYAFWSGRAFSNMEYVQGYNLNTTIPAYCTEYNLDARYNCYRDSDTQEYISYFDAIVPENHRTPALATDLAVIIVLGFVSRFIAYLFLNFADASKRR